MTTLDRVKSRMWLLNISEKNFKARINSFSIEKFEVTNIFPRMVHEEGASTLFELVTLDEIKEFLAMFKRDKSPDLDGWTVEFFSTFFDLVSEDLLLMVEESRKLGTIPGSLNSTFLDLIPKEKNPTRFSLCNLCYKLISKVIANRIKPILSQNLSEEQLGFLEGRRIQGVIGTTHECLHSLSKKKLKYLVLKLDLPK